MKPDYAQTPYNAAHDATNDFRCLKFTAGEASTNNALPRSWYGRWVTMRSLTSDVAVHYGISDSSSAAIDANATATAAGASTGVGEIIPSDGSEIQRHLPIARRDKTLYFVRETESGAGNAVVVIALSDYANDA